MKKRRRILFILPILIIGFFGFRLLFSSDLSTQQQELINMWGYPDQFQISYVQKSEDQLIRSEIWFYNDKQTKVQFLAGKSVVSSSYTPESQISTTLKPEDFDFFQTKKDVDKLLGEESIDTIDFLPGISDEENQLVYLSPQAIFIIEYDHLSFFETIGLDISDESVSTDEEEIVEPTPAPFTSSYHSDFLGFSTTFPQNWYLSDDILTTYDANKPLDQIELPEKFLKCDFLTYNSDSLQINDSTTIQEKDPTITKGTAVDLISDDGPGLGDSIIFRIQQNDIDLALLCYAYDSEFESDLISLLKSITFDER